MNPSPSDSPALIIFYESFQCSSSCQHQKETKGWGVYNIKLQIRYKSHMHIIWKVHARAKKLEQMKVKDKQKNNNETPSFFYIKRRKRNK